MTLILKKPPLVLPKNTTGCDYFVGDLHGHYSSFCRGLDAIKFNAEVDRVFSVGDLVDRGPDSLSCLRLMHKDWFYSVVGNHERMLYQNINDNNAKKNLENGWQFRLSESERDECIDLVKDMHWTITISADSESVGIVHADIPDGMPWKTFCQRLSRNNTKLIECATWSRKRHDHQLDEVPGLKWLFVGHSCQEVPRQFKNVICIDTGVYIPGRYCKTYGLTFSFIKDGKPAYHTIYSKK